MRSNLKILLVIAILMIAVAPILAQVVLSGGVSITERTDLVGISSRCNVQRYGRPIGGTSTKMGLQTVVIAHKSMSYKAALSTVGISKDRIINVELTPDGGVTGWVPEFVDGKGYTLTVPIGKTSLNTRCKVLLPKKHEHDRDKWEERVLPIDFAGLTPGEMSSLEWRLTVRDVKNKIVIVFIPLTYMGERIVSVGSDIMVQEALPDFDNIPDTVEGDHVAFSYLRGFIPAWASPDPAELLRQKMVNDIINPPQVIPPVVQPQYQSQVEPPSVVQPQYQPQPQPQPQPQSESKIEERSSLPNGVTIVGKVKVEVETSSAPSVQIVKSIISIYIWKDDQSVVWRNQLINLARYRVGQVIEFKNGTQIICAAEVTKVEPGFKILEMRIFQGDWPSTGSTFNIVEEARQ